MEGFDFADIEIDAFDMIEFESPSKKNPLRQNRYMKPRLSKKVPEARVKYKNAEKMLGDVNERIIEGHRIDAVISGDFIFGDFLEALIVKNNWLAEDLTISTLSVSQENIDSLANLINGGFIAGTMNLMVSDYFYSHNRASIQYIYDELDKDDKFQLAVASVHTKIILLKTEDRHVVIHGSANMRSSACVECFTVEQDKVLYEFHKEWHDAIIEQYKTINKPIRTRNPIGAK